MNMEINSLFYQHNTFQSKIYIFSVNLKSLGTFFEARYEHFCNEITEFCILSEELARFPPQKVEFEF